MEKVKSNYIKWLTIVLMLFILVGCTNIEDSISEEEAKQLVLNQHIGTPSIVSIEIKDNAYYVQWVNTENKESGTDKVTKDGKVKIMFEARAH